MNLPDFILEPVFSYLNWNDRARAARVCRQWQRVFHSPSLWRIMVFKPPARPLTRLQYDMKGYRMSCCLRTIGSYVRHYRFVRTEDIFLLNRTLSLIAKFLEASASKKASVSQEPANSTFIPGEEDDTALDEELESENGSTSSTDDNLMSWEDEDDSYRESVHLSKYAGLIMGDPDAEATLELVLKLQERELFGQSDSDTSNENFDVSSFLGEVRSRSFSTSRPTIIPGASARGHVYQRSQSCRYPHRHHHPRPPPSVISFLLDFHCEVDESRGSVYGTGGALLSTIRRVIRQLSCVERLRFTDLFLSLPDARNLVLDLTETTSNSLVDLNLVHLNKLSSDPTIQSAPVVHLGQAVVDSTSAPADWYLLDSRWLAARPNRLHQNPLADIASLFPNLKRLSIAPTQLTGPMLLRLLYQTNLMELFLVETDFTRFTLQQTSLQSSSFLDHYNLLHLDHSPHQDVGKLHQDTDEHLIEWGEDVPYYRDSLTSTDISLVAVSSIWHAIRPAVWHAARALRPNLSVQLRNYFLRITLDGPVLLTQNGALVPRLLSLWPMQPCPVSALIFRTSKGPQFTQAFLSLSNKINLGTYSTTLTTLVISIEASSGDQLDPPSTVEASAKSDNDWKEINEILRSLPSLCPSLLLLALGGNVCYLSVVTLLVICRHHNRHRSLCDSNFDPHLDLIVEDNCCSLEDQERKDIPATVLAWYSAIDSVGKDNGRRKTAAERCITDALKLPHWQFVSSAQFQSKLYDFLN
ncbi:F-box/LRR-repeat protein 21 [Clonorchis sinensis]|uniref:F-box/LRR-repeat protein 21 n=1 Tax=Clonorchis sinensis TaxID=79923 RepID=G7YR67_CLOSI|nr:F-box/LRR-repeat protein 21 [Clonorchis sinensis]